MNNKLYNYLFHFNHHTNRWAAFKRDDREKYFNTGNNRDKQDGIVFANDIQTLIDFLSK